MAMIEASPARAIAMTAWYWVGMGIRFTSEITRSMASTTCVAVLPVFQLASCWRRIAASASYFATFGSLGLVILSTAVRLLRATVAIANMLLLEFLHILFALLWAAMRFLTVA